MTRNIKVLVGIEG